MSFPRSCIESAEYLIQCIAAGKKLAWAGANKTITPHVIAEFGDGVTIDISAEVNFSDTARPQLKDYEFPDGLPQIGQGLICLRRVPSEEGYAMHLGAVIAVGEGGDVARISNMMEAASVKVEFATPQTIDIGSVEAFRSDNGLDDSEYALGILRPAS